MSNRISCCFLFLLVVVASVLLFLTRIALVAAIDEEERSIYIVLVDGKSTLASSRLNNDRKMNSHAELYSEELMIMSSHDQLLENSLESGSYKKIHSFTHLTSGFAIHTTPSQAAKLRMVRGVKRVERDRGAKLMTTYTPQLLGLPQGVWPHQVPVDQGYSNYNTNNAGEGIVIGFVDTGINPHHPSFAASPDQVIYTSLSKNHTKFSGGICQTGPRFPPESCNGKIISARYFAAGAQTIANTTHTSLNSSIDILSPFDAVGHGTHVASTAAGNYGVPVIVNGFFYGRASGMAPRAKIAVYKALYPTIGTLTDILAAIDQAVKDRVDILTLSVGPDEAPEDSITFLNAFEIFLLLARRAGVFVVQAAGNNGPGPTTVVSFSPWAMGVAACTTGRSYPATLILGNGQRIPGVGLSGPTGFSYKLVLAQDVFKTNSNSTDDDDDIECQNPEAFEPSLVKGNIIICTFSNGFYNATSTVSAIIQTAKTLHFAGFILLANPDFGDFIAEPVPFTIPGIMIPNTKDANIVTQYYNHNQRTIISPATASIGEGRIANFLDQQQRRVPVVARFSSRGPDIIDNHRNPTDVLKPDILAPGHQIWAAWSPLSVQDPDVEGNNFAILSGTSMATPHVAGIAALIKQRNPHWTPSMIVSALSTTATQSDNYGDIIHAQGFELGNLTPSTPFDMGSGLVNPITAMDPGLIISPREGDYVRFLCSLPNVQPKQIESDTGGTCRGSFTNPYDLNLPSLTITSLKGIQVVKRTLTNVGNQTEIYLTRLIQPQGVSVKLNPSCFTIGPLGTQDLEIHLNVTQPMSQFTFGWIILTGSLFHTVKIPLSLFPVM